VAQSGDVTLDDFAEGAAPETIIKRVFECNRQGLVETEKILDHRALIKSRHAYWDCHRVGLACQPLETPEGWLLFYHGVRNTTGGAIYRMGIALLDLEEPWKVLRRSEEWIFGPSELYERVGDVGGVVFPSGITVTKETDQVNLYYGAADCTVAVATAKLSDLIDYIMSCPEPEG